MVLPKPLLNRSIQASSNSKIDLVQQPPIKPTKNEIKHSSYFQLNLQYHEKSEQKSLEKIIELSMME
jgi:hypothetical protein